MRTFGGIGARTRRGFGTLAVDAAPDLTAGCFDHAWLRRDNVDDLGPVVRCVAAAIEDLGIIAAASRGGSLAGLPRYPCFAANRYRHSADDEDQLPGLANGWTAALDRSGHWLWGFRHNKGRRITGTLVPTGVHSQSYTDVVQPFLDNPAGRHTQNGPMTAAALGLPVPYSDHQGPRVDGKATQRRAIVEVLIDGQPARRASPLWLRVRHDGASWRLRSLAFATEWLPPEAEPRLRITKVRGPGSAQVDLLTQTQVETELNRWFGP